MLKLIRSYLEAGVMADGVKQPSEEGTPQDLPLSPLLSNVYLDDLDRMLEKRGHRFVRYADDITIYVGSERAAQRVMQERRPGSSSSQRLKLRVNREKSAVDHATRRTLLGFGFFESEEVRLRSRSIDKARKRAKDRLRLLTSRSWGVSMERRIGAINRFSRGMDGLLRVGRHALGLRGTRRHGGAAGCGRCAGRSGRRSPHQTAQPDRYRHPCREAHEWANSPARDTGEWRGLGLPTRGLLQRLLARAGPQQIPSDPYRRLRDATRTAGCGPRRPGGVGGAGVSPAPTRF